MAQINLTNYRSIMSDRVQAGSYKVKIDHAEVGTDRAKNPQLMIHARILSGEFKGSELVERLPLAQDSKALFRTVGFLTGMGVPTPRKKIQFDEKKFIGRNAIVEVVDNEYQGRVTSQINSWMKAPSAAEAADDSADEMESIEDLGEAPEESEETENESDGTVDDTGLDIDDIEM